jgi:hypothetical protein
MSEAKRRVRLAAPVRAVFAAGGTRGEGSVYDVSRSGFFVRSPTLLENGTMLEAALVGPMGERISVQGVVRWNTSRLAYRPKGPGFGVCVLRSSRDFQGFVERELSKPF